VHTFLLNWFKSEHMLVQRKSLVIEIRKGVVALILLFLGTFLVRWVCSLPKVFSFGLMVWIAVGFALVLLASFLISQLLYLKLKMERRYIFAACFIIVLFFLSFTGGHSSLHSFISRIGHNGIVHDTQIIIKEKIPGGIAPKQAIDIADNYLRAPFFETFNTDPREKYIKMMYQNSWMKKVVVSITPYSCIKYMENIYKLPISETYNENEKLYKVSFYFGSVLHKGDNRLIVYIDRDGNVVGTETWILLQ